MELQVQDGIVTAQSPDPEMLTNSLNEALTAVRQAPGVVQVEIISISHEHHRHPIDNTPYYTALMAVRIVSRTQEMPT